MVLETHELEGRTVQIVYDDCPSNPREDDNVGTMVFFHRRGGYGDKHSYDPGNSLEELVTAIEAEHGPICYLRVRAYEHGGIAMTAYEAEESPSGQMACQWDSGWLGVIFVSMAGVKSEWGDNPDMDIVRRVLKGEVDTYCKYVNGEVYGYLTLDAKGEVEDSCYGFYSTEDALESATENIGVTL